MRDLARDIVDDEVMDYEASVLEAKALIRPLTSRAHPLISISIPPSINPHLPHLGLELALML